MVVDVTRLAGRLRTMLNGGYLQKPRTVAGLLGDGTTTKRVAVSGSTVHVYFRPLLSSAELWEVRHLTPSVPRWHDWPVLCAYNEKTKQWEVAETDTDRMPGLLDDPNWRYIGEHAEQHIINEEAVGGDPVWIYRRAIVDLRPTVPPDGSLRVYIQRGDLPFPETPLWESDYGPDLTGDVPGSGTVWVTHYIDNDGVVGTEVGDAYTPLMGVVPPPSAPEGTVPVAYVDLASGSTEVTEAMLWDARRFSSAMISGDVRNALRLVWLGW